LADLKAVLGSIYGSATATTFVLPNLKGRVPMGSGVGASATNWTIGTSTGAETHTLTTAQMPIHNHGLTVVDMTTNDVAGSASRNLPINKVMGAPDAGGGQPHPIMQPSLVVNYIIKY
jgi:microcystin-dependent protein